MKRFAFLLLIVAVAACGRFYAPVDLLPNEQTVNVGHGELAHFSFTADRVVTLDYGDGTSESFVCDGSAVAATHAYSVVGTYQAQLRSNGALLDAAIVYAVADLPIVRIPFWHQGWVVDERETIHFQVSESAHACDTATGAFDLYGISAGDGETEVRMFAWDANGTPIGIFDFSRPQGDQAVWGKWVPLPDIEVEALTFSVFMNYYNLDVPKLPLAPRGCGDPDEWPEPPAPPGVGEDGYGLYAKFLLEARNQYTAEGSEPSVFWRVWYKEDGC